MLFVPKLVRVQGVKWVVSSHKSDSSCCTTSLFSYHSEFIKNRMFSSESQKQEPWPIASKGLDPNERQKIIQHFYNMLWKDDSSVKDQFISSLDATNALRVLQFKQKMSKFRATGEDFSSTSDIDADEEFSVQRRLALSAYHRSLIKHPQCIFLAHGEKVYTCEAKLPHQSSNSTVLPMWLNVQDAQKYANGTIPSSEIDNYNTVTVPGDYIPNIWQFCNWQHDIVVNPDSGFSSHLGLVSVAQKDSFEAQRASLLIKGLLQAQRIADPTLLQLTVSILANNTGEVYITGTQQNTMYLHIYTSGIRTEAAHYFQKKGGSNLSPLSLTWKQIVENFATLPKHVKGVTLDRMPSDLEMFLGPDCHSDKLDLLLLITEKPK